MGRSVVLQAGLDGSDPLQLAAGLIGLGFAAATAAGLVALAYRWYVRERVQTGLGVLFGLTVVALYLGTTGALGAVISGEEAVLASSEVLPNLSAFAVGAVSSLLGIRAGDAIGTDLFAATGGRNVDRDVSDIVQSVGRVTSVRLPAEIDDIVGYDPMPEATKEQLADRRFLFPRRLRKSELEERLVARLKTDYGVGHVDLELADDGSVEYIAVGSRAAGIGPTLPPATNAVAVRADPAHAASAGDLVQVWETDPLQRVLTGELRGVAGDIVTVAIDASDTPKLDPATEYKLVTLPVQDRPDREFASLLRAAAETMGTVTVAAGSELAGKTVGALGVSVAAITREGEPPEAIPTRDRVLDPGDVIYAIGKPEALRQTETLTNRQRPADATPVEGGSDGPAADAGTAPATAAAAGETDEPATEIPDAEGSDTAGPSSGEATDDHQAPTESVDRRDEPSEGSEPSPPVSGDEGADDGGPEQMGDDPADGGDTEELFPADETDEDEPMQVWDPEEQLGPADDADADDGGEDEEDETRP